MKKALYGLFMGVLILLQGPAFADSNAYHWSGQEQFFEGWYFKVSDPATQRSFLFIYAVFNPDGRSPDSCGFMMAGNNSPGEAGLIYQQYPVDDFAASYDVFDMAVSSSNRAWGDLTTLHATGSTADSENHCSWSFDLEVTDAWRNTMGWMQNLPSLQTYWYVGAMKARASGWIEWNGELFTFDKAIGYQEKNWGDEFPESWYWLQANSFDDPKACCLSVGAATMPLGGLVVPACGIGLIYDGRLYTFSFPQQPALIQADIEPGTWQVTARKGRYQIVIDAWCDTDELLNLRNPTAGGIKAWTWESVRGTVRFQLFERWGLWYTKIAEATSDLAGTEFGGQQWLGWEEQLPAAYEIGVKGHEQELHQAD
jgi:tocopherol cyclase